MGLLCFSTAVDMESEEKNTNYLEKITLVRKIAIIFSIIGTTV